jgi:hypothetical protein
MKAFETVAVALAIFVSKNVTVFTNDAPAAVVTVIVPTPEVPSAMMFAVNDSAFAITKLRPVIAEGAVTVKYPAPVIVTVIVSLARASAVLKFFT